MRSSTCTLSRQKCGITAGVCHQRRRSQTSCGNEKITGVLVSVSGSGWRRTNERETTNHTDPERDRQPCGIRRIVRTYRRGARAEHNLPENFTGTTGTEKLRMHRSTDRETLRREPGPVSVCAGMPSARDIMKGQNARRKSTKRINLVRAGKASRYLALYSVDEAIRKAGLVTV